MCDKTSYRPGSWSAVDEVAIRRMMPARSEKELREAARALEARRARDLEDSEHPFCEEGDR